MICCPSAVMATQESSRALIWTRNAPGVEEALPPAAASESWGRGVASPVPGTEGAGAAEADMDAADAEPAGTAGADAGGAASDAAVWATTGASADGMLAGSATRAGSPGLKDLSREWKPQRAKPESHNQQGSRKPFPRNTGAIVAGVLYMQGKFRDRDGRGGRPHYASCRLSFRNGRRDGKFVFGNRLASSTPR